jgi:predicted TIM-barrel fold metal-dependent hydrolase
MYGSFDDLYGAYSEVAASLDEGARDQLFARNAERAYSC